MSKCACIDKIYFNGNIYELFVNIRKPVLYNLFDAYRGLDLARLKR